ncbi:MAG: HAMP domain-containing protein, partial [Planctomycetes bacterium]|nr:HAMP domain-containing protein [Planctomycetota bacterium]
MQLPLRARILLFVAAINAAVFGVGVYHLSARVGEDRDRLARDFTEVLLYTLQPMVDEGGKIRVAEILRWPNWRNFDDAIIVSANWEVAKDGTLRPQGAYLNPIGRTRRSAGLDEQEVLRAIAEVARSRVSTPVAGGIAIPVLDSEDRVWGGCWFSVSREAARGLLVQLLPWFLVSTALLTIGTFAMLRRFVLDPVEALADGARRLGAGELSARLAVPARKDELAELIRGFNQMAETVEGFNARLAREVEIATDNARRAENAAMTQRRLAATGELAAGIAHEVNNPLGGLINAVEALEKKELPPAKRAQYLGLLRNGLERIQRTVGQVLRLAPRAPQSVP